MSQVRTLQFSSYFESREFKILDPENLNLNFKSTFVNFFLNFFFLNHVPFHLQKRNFLIFNIAKTPNPRENLQKNFTGPDLKFPHILNLEISKFWIQKIFEISKFWIFEIRKKSRFQNFGSGKFSRF